MNKETLLNAMAKAADFFEANPDKRIVDNLAETERGEVVQPSDPRACCFCALGRIAYECDLGSETNNFYHELGNMGLIYQRVYQFNDHPNKTTDDVVEALRNPPTSWFK